MADKIKFRRLFDLHRRFMDYAQLTVSQMMSDYGVKRRTVNRDLNDLEELGVALVSRELPDGHKVWSILNRDRKIKVGYNLTDLTALFMGRRLFDFLGGTLLEESLDKVYENIENQLKKEKDFIRARDLARKVYLVSEGPKKLKKKQIDVLDEVLTGLLENRKLSIDYVNAQGAANKFTVLPYTLVAYKRGLYLLALIDGSKAIRTFALERIRKAKWQGGTSFELPEDFDPEKYFKKAFFLQTGKPEKVDLIFSKTTEPFIRIRKFHHSQRTKQLPDGRIKMTLRVPVDEWDFEIVNFVLSFHENVEVVAPARLRESVKQKLENALGLYA